MATTSIPTFADTYNEWFANEMLPFAQNFTSADLDPAKFKKDASGYYIATPDAPVWSWTTGPDYWAQKQALDQRYLDSVAEYNRTHGTNVQPDQSVLGAVQPNPTYRAPDSGGWFDSITDVIGGAVDTVGDVVGGALDFAQEHPLETALLAAGVYYAPEIGAYLSADGAVVGTTAEQAAANTGAVELGTTSGAAWDAATSGAYGGPVAGTAAALGAAGAGLGAGLTASEVIKALPLVPVVNQIAGDPLGLNKTQTPAASGTTGFQMVPIPTEWKAPTYQVSQAPIDLNSIFTNQNLLTGTQWENLPSQRNMSFNDIFASGQQATPMGNPVNINNLVSAILGQTSTSQKST